MHAYYFRIGVPAANFSFKMSIYKEVHMSYAFSSSNRIDDKPYSATAPSAHV